MARSPSFDGAEAYRDQIATVRSIKDEIVGHVQRKEIYIGQGLLATLVGYLRTPRSPARLNGKETRTHISPQRKLSDADAVLLQSLQVLNSLAIAGGPAFLAPIYASDAIPAVLSHLSPVDNHPLLSLTALRVLDNLADAAGLAEAEHAALLADALFDRRNLEILYAILASKSTHRTVQQQKCLVAGLISKLCKDTVHRNALANAGVLDALATLLVSFVVARGEVIPDAPELAKEHGLASWIPSAAPPSLQQHLVLDAVSAIVADSRFRAGMFLYSPSIMAIFPVVEYHTSSKYSKNAWSALERAAPAASYSHTRKAGAMEYLMPVVPRVPSSHASQLAPFGYPGSRDRHSSKPSSARLAAWDPWSGLAEPTTRQGSDKPNEVEAEDSESPIVLWLVHFIRSSEPLDRILAASLLASLFKAGFTRPDRDLLFGHAIVPVLCEMIEKHNRESESSSTALPEPAVALNWAILEQAPEVLARLVADCGYLQQAAYESGIIKTVSKLLKDTYEPLPAQHAPRPWSTVPKRPVQHGDATRRIGEPGHLPIYLHRIKVRESSLKLIAAMSTFKDELRKAFVEQEVVPYIVESLQPCPRKPSLAIEKTKEKGGGDEEPPALATGEYSPYGNNPSSVIVAACHVLRLLSRSISIVRTSLKDHGAAMPVFSLLKHADVEVQIAACAVMINLLTDVSPMRERLVGTGILKILCKHAHSQSPGLRLNSMWALKHLVATAENDLKKKALEELSSGWLIQLVCDDTEDSALHERLMKSERRMSVDGDVEEMDPDLYETDSRPWSWPGLYRASSSHPPVADRLRMTCFQRAEKKLVTLREAEINPTRKARSDDLAIQEQGLNFIRNLLVGPCSTTGFETPAVVATEMVDYVFSELGQDRLFDILQGKLRPKVLHAFERRHPSLGREPKVVYPQATVIEVVVYILVHMAASVPRHRQLVITQTELLRSLVTQFSNGSVGVRRALCHLLNNLMLEEDSEDTQASHQRAVELKRLGFQARLESLQHEDVDLDVKEQARTAVFYMRQGHA
ncbi:ARM repeat-containing protein [Thozetella sp. PMI_491]|nr:ARM repeat-containing protein [Thozetella sp. PMI_491]